MFTEFIRQHPIRDLLAGGVKKLYPPAEDRAAWEGIAPEFRNEIREMAEKYAGIPYPARTASGFRACVRTGDRQADEKP